MSQAPSTPCPGSPKPTLTAPMMSASSSTASHNTKMWSAETSRRGSNASSIVPNVDSPDNGTKKTTDTPAATTSKPESAPTPAPAPRPRLVNLEDPMSRVYPKPESELDVSEALDREPLRWSLGHWRKNARDARVVQLSREVTKQRFEETKADLLRSFASMQVSKK